MPYIKSVTMPAIEAGLAKAGKTRDGFELSYSCFVVTGRDEAEFAASKKAAQERIAFYGSTPAYKGVLESIGCGELQGELNAMSKQGRWKEMGTLISDDMLNEFGVVGEPKDIAPQMLSRYGSFVDRTSASFPVSDEEQRAGIIQALRAG
jgi:alkanesulfonate monooxygenase SsuD/methylene tetrahydromethanopterin reductase-like flavin-dependent oxidoreductase (luciferase family)